MKYSQVYDIIIKHIEQKHSQTFLIQGGFGIGQKQLAKAIIRNFGQENTSDTVWIHKDPDKNQIGLTQISPIKQILQTSPLYGQYTFIVIEDADFLNEKSQNSLLKIIEEPPIHSNIIFLSNYDQVLSTIVSRCLTFSLHIDTFEGLTLGRQDLEQDLRYSSELSQFYTAHWNEYISLWTNHNPLEIFSFVETIPDKWLEYCLFIWESIHWLLLLAETDKTRYTMIRIPQETRNRIDYITDSISLQHKRQALQELDKVKKQILFTNHKNSLALEQFLLHNFSSL
jgi:DNA polymerase III gamma/tau subunit